MALENLSPEAKRIAQDVGEAVDRVATGAWGRFSVFLIDLLWARATRHPKTAAGIFVGGVVALVVGWLV